MKLRIKGVAAASLMLSMVLGSGLDAYARAKYVFYFIGDGMGMGHVNAAETYMRDVVKNGEGLLMLDFPVASQVRTYSANSPITDSAAAGTALSTGSKTNNHRIARSPEGEDLYSISRDFMRAGYEVGVATTVAGDDATPAAFYAHADDRGQKEIITPMAVGSGLRFLGGGNFKGITDREGNTTSWLDDMRADGYVIVRGIQEFEALPTAPEKALMLSPMPQGDQVGYTIDSIPGAMTCADLTKACLETLVYNERRDDAPGFFMMVEGGNIDWAAHANDGGAVIKEVLNFQQAIDVAYKFYLEHPEETLIVVTADHDTGGMALGRNDNKYSPRLALADYQKISKDRFTDYCQANYAPGMKFSWEDMERFLKQNLGFWGGVRLTDEETADLREAFDRTFVSRDATDEKTWYKDFNLFSVKVYDIFNRYLGIGFTTSSHTGNFVPLYAVGEGASLFQRNLDNTEIPRLILRAAGLGGE